MSADWSAMKELSGAGFLGDTHEAKRNWIEEYIPPEDRPQVLEAIAAAIAKRGCSSSSIACAEPSGLVPRAT